MTVKGVDGSSTSFPGYLSVEMYTRNYNESGYLAGSVSSSNTDDDTYELPNIPEGGAIP